MQLPLQIDENTGESLQVQIFEQIRCLIVEGCLKPGARMPASRSLAADLGVSRNTVVLVYEQLVSEGYLEMRQPVGTFVARNLIHEGPLQAESTVAEESVAARRRRARLVFRGNAHVVVSPFREPVAYDFWVGRPDARLLPYKAWQQLINRKLHHLRGGISGYSDPAGLRQLREAVADYVGFARGVKATADQVLIINGIQEGLNILARLFVRSGTKVAIEDPCYRGAANVFESYGAELMPVPVDDDGADVTRLPREAAFIYITPSHQYPTGATLSPDRRENLLDWAERIGAYIVEDDYDADFYYDGPPLPALQSGDTQSQVIYLGTFSKSLAAGLRAGYMIVPEPLIEPVATVKALLNNCSPWLVQTLLAEFIESGAFMHHLRRVRTSYCARRNCLLEVLREHFGDVDVRGIQSGMHVLWHLPGECPPPADLERRCREAGVGIYGLESGNALTIGKTAAARHQRALMLGYAALNEDEITEGINRLAQTMDPAWLKRSAAQG